MLNNYLLINLFSLSKKLGIKPVFLIFLFLSPFSSFIAQENLVPNGSFEEYNNCPSYAEGFYIDACKYWNSPTFASPDYFNACSTDLGSDSFTQFSIPQNYIGFQEARTGSAYAGLLYSEGNDSSFTGDQSYSEYIQVKLSQTLIKGKFYMLKFYVSNAATNICGNSIGAYFSKNEIQIFNDYNLMFVPNYQSSLTYFFCDSIKWFEQHYQFIANGTEEYLVIGVFTHLYESQTSDFNGNIISGQNQYGANQYFFIDDVSLVESDFTLPNVFTPNNDGVNDVFKIEGFSENYSLTILNRWGIKVFKTNDINKEFWDGNSNNEESSDGIYFYILENSENKKTGYIHLIR